VGVGGASEPKDRADEKRREEDASCHYELFVP
jgi:hypothetical protein